MATAFSIRIRMASCAVRKAASATRKSGLPSSAASISMKSRPCPKGRAPVRKLTTNSRPGRSYRKLSKMKVPLLDLKAQHAAIRGGVLAAVTEVLDSQVCIGGPKVAELEQKIAAMSGCRFAVGASSGTDALLNVLMSLDIGPGDEVITTPFTFFATAGSIARTGATPVFVDIDPKT